MTNCDSKQEGWSSLKFLFPFLARRQNHFFGSCGVAVCSRSCLLSKMSRTLECKNHIPPNSPAFKLKQPQGLAMEWLLFVLFLADSKSFALIVIFYLIVVVAALRSKLFLIQFDLFLFHYSWFMLIYFSYIFSFRSGE